MSTKRGMMWIAILVSGLIVVFLSNEWNRAALGSEGYIEKGTKFGLTIGDRKQEITEHLVTRGLVDESTSGANETGYNSQSCLLHIYPSKYEVQVWGDDSWRRGTICIAFLDGKLARMSWHYNMLQP